MISQAQFQVPMMEEQVNCLSSQGCLGLEQWLTGNQQYLEDGCFPPVAVIANEVTLSLMTCSFFELQFSYWDALY